MKAVFKLTLLLMAVVCVNSNVYSRASILAGEPQSDWAKQYQPIDDPKALDFLREGLSYAIELYGEPRITVKNVLLRFSYPARQNNSLKRGFQLTELADRQKGSFTIYLSHKPQDYSFYGQLAHEIAHLLNAQLYDPYVEGLNTVFAEQLLKRHDLDWEGWEDYFKKGGEAFYATTYFMMKEVSQVAGEDNMRAFLSYAKYNPEDPKRMHIDIEGWLNSLPNSKRTEVRKIILRYAPSVQKAISSTNVQYTFLIPK